MAVAFLLPLPLLHGEQAGGDEEHTYVVHWHAWVEEAAIEPLLGPEGEWREGAYVQHLLPSFDLHAAMRNAREEGTLLHVPDSLSRFNPHAPAGNLIEGWAYSRAGGVNLDDLADDQTHRVLWNASGAYAVEQTDPGVRLRVFRTGDGGPYDDPLLAARLEVFQQGEGFQSLGRLETRDDIDLELARGESVLLLGRVAEVDGRVVYQVTAWEAVAAPGWDPAVRLRVDLPQWLGLVPND